MTESTQPKTLSQLAQELARHEARHEKLELELVEVEEKIESTKAEMLKQLVGEQND